MMIKMSKDVKPVTVIKQDGPDFSIEVKTPMCTNVNSFSLGKETEITAMDGRKFKVGLLPLLVPLLLLLISVMDHRGERGESKQQQNV